MAGIFNDRSTQLVFNDYLPSVISPWVAMERKAEEMCHGTDALVSDMQLQPHIGWQLRSYMMDPGDKAQLSAAQPGHLSMANGATVAPYHFEENTYHQDTSHGVTYSPLVAAASAPMIALQLPTGQSVTAANLSAEVAAIPFPHPDENQAGMNRVYTFSGLLPWDALLFEWWPPSSVIGTRGFFGCAYFDASPGMDADALKNASKAGTGQMALKMRGDGRAFVSELLVDGTWKRRYSFSWDPSPMSVVDSLVSIAIIPRMWQNSDGTYQGDRVTFVASSHVTSGFTIIEQLTEIAVLAIRAAAKQVPVYNIPLQAVKTFPSTHTTKVQVDIAQDTRATFAVSKHVYRSTGYLVDDYMPLEQAIDQSQDFFVYLQGVVPSGTTLAIEVDDENGTALASTSGVAVLNTSKGQTVRQSFKPTQGQRMVRLKVTANADSGHVRTPTIRRYQIDRAPIYTSANPIPLAYAPTQNAYPALPRTAVDSVEITEQQTDPGAENATFVVWDLTGELDFLSQVQMVPVLCRTKQGTAGVWSDQFRGYVVEAMAERMRYSSSHVYPAPEATKYTLTCAGEWARASECLTPRRKTWAENPTTGASYRVTDIIRYYAELDLPDYMVDVPDIDVPLLTTDETAYTQESNAKTVDIMQQYCDDYLGSYMLFDVSAGTKGMRRMLQQKHAPYNNLAIFEREHPTILAGDGIPRLPHWAGSYPDVMGTGGQTIKPTFIQAGTYTHYLEKAEGNSVTVYGCGVGQDANAAGKSDGALLSQQIVNVQSYNFLNLAPGATGYPTGFNPDGSRVPEYYGRVVPIRVVDYKLGTQRAVDWKARRIFEKACFTRFHLSFMAPLILVTDVTDTKQQRPRRLRYYDPVQVRRSDGTLAQFLVVSCVPTYRKDNMQMARYTLVTQSNIGTIGTINNVSRGLQTARKALGRTLGVNWQYGPPIGSQQKQGEALTSNLMGLPTPLSYPIQDLNPFSGTFGRFIDALAAGSNGSMAAYDAIPHA